VSPVLDFSSSRSGEPALALIAKELGIAYGTAWNTPRAGAAGSFSDAILGPDTDQIYTRKPLFLIGAVYPIVRISATNGFSINDDQGCKLDR
jgi:hypothetical protein